MQSKDALVSHNRSELMKKFKCLCLIDWIPLDRTGEYSSFECESLGSWLQYIADGIMILFRYSLVSSLAFRVRAMDSIASKSCAGVSLCMLFVFFFRSADPAYAFFENIF